MIEKSLEVKWHKGTVKEEEKYRKVKAKMGEKMNIYPK